MSSCFLPISLCLVDVSKSPQPPASPQLSRCLKGRCFGTATQKWRWPWQLVGSFIGHSRKLVSDAAQSI